ncbi:hypothetical protein HYALB_00000621 [Hymenoscyphus albidus]|uniref:Cytochrome P450 n=1 Tax=Hymenoscyphus albidus TaxID=595503 RepID=A0A9N9M3G5_9HELO|nr:hypothetical protein HYALB_00000621 [Hymenoscyphus albidus]
MRTSYAISLSKAFYGPDNPILDNPSFIPPIWDFEESIPILFANIFPSILAPTAINTKKLLLPAFKEYYDKGLDKNATYFIKARAKAARECGIPNADMGAFEITVLFASLTNAVPNAFSMLCNVFADPDLKAEICEEVAGVTTKTIIDGVTYMTIDTTAFTAKCPLLIAA